MATAIAKPKPRTWHEVRNIVHNGGLAMRLERQGAGYVAELELPLRDGRVIVCRGSCTFADAMRARGHDPKALAAVAGCGADLVGAVDAEAELSPAAAWGWDAVKAKSGKAPSAATPAAKVAWWQAQGKKRRSGLRGMHNVWLGLRKKQKPGSRPLDVATFVKWWDKLPKMARRVLLSAHDPKPGILDQIGGFISKAAKSDAFKQVIKVAGSVVRNPVVIGALGAVTGGAALPALAAANAAVGLLDVAQKALPGTPEKKAATNVLRAAQILHGRAQGKRPIPKGVRPLPRGKFGGGEAMTPKQAEKLRGYLRTVKAARIKLAPVVKAPAMTAKGAELVKRRKLARTIVQAKDLERIKRDPERAKIAAVLPKPDPRDVARYVVSIARAVA